MDSLPVLSWVMILSLFLLFPKSVPPPREMQSSSIAQIKSPKRAVIAPYQSSVDISWMSVYFPNLTSFVYATNVDEDDFAVAPARTIRLAKGNEAMVYLDYITEHYEDLADQMVFVHGNRHQWHQADIVQDLARLQWQNITDFANLRCSQVPGCNLGTLLKEFALAVLRRLINRPFL